MPAGPSHTEHDREYDDGTTWSGSGGRSQPATPAAKSSTMSSFLSSLSPSRELAFEGSGSTREAESTSAAPDGGAAPTSTTDRIRSALSNMGYKGDEDKDKGKDKGTTTGTFSSFFKRS